ncbi:AAA family ATPase [Defluviitalea phaphyphila]|uniref:AAA family ATPase n=1 Tax=Defluviitalea phaphyphila TaxID=1473580 RepID=UPI0007314273|nr:SbcC/MukB-like Walker B domain-containing protein [Defluviitalea phaphyphila]
MRPRLLKIKGLNSFIEEQVIDFTKLTERGLFGIFGPTGSGKSTILDAITLALYGEIARNTKEFINSEVDLLNILYEFSIRDGKDIKIYVVERSFKKDDEGIRKSKSARFYIKNKENNIEIIAEGITNVTRKVEKILGLNAEDFTRSVVLPQGKFNEFLKLTGSDRRNMLERIFGLEKYGKELIEKIKIAKNEKRQNITNIESQLTIYGDLTEEKYKNEKNSFEILKKEEEKLKKELEEINNKYEKYKLIWELQGELEFYEIKNKELENKLDEYTHKKQILKNAEKAQMIKPLIDEIEEIKIKKKENEKQLDILNKKLEEIKKEIDTLEIKYSEIIERRNTEYPLLLQKEANLSQALKMLEEKKGLEQEREKLRKSYSKNKNTIEKFLVKDQEYSKQIKELETNINKIEQRKQEISIDPFVREELQKGYEIEREYIKLEQNKKELEEKLKKLEKEILSTQEKYELIVKENEEKRKIYSDIDEKLKNLKKNSPGNNEIIFEKHKIIEEEKSKYIRLNEEIDKKKEIEKNLKEILVKIKEKEELKQNLYKKKEDLNKKIEELEKSIENMRRQNMAAILAKDLKEGEKCPVCGSIYHGQVYFNLNEEKYNNMLEEEKFLLNEFKKSEEEFNKISIEYEGLCKEANKLKIEINNINLRIGEQNIEDIKNKIISEEKELQKLQIKIKNWEENIQVMDQKIQKLKDEINKLEKEEAILNERLLKDKSQYNDIIKQHKEIEIKLSNIYNEYIQIKNKYSLNKIEDKINQFKKWDKIRINLDKEEKNTREIIKMKEKEKEENSKKIAELEQKNAQIKQSGLEKKEIIEKYNEQISKLSENKNPSTYIKEVKEQIKKLVEMEEKLKNALEDMKNKKQNIDQQNIKTKTYNNTLNQLDTEKQNKLSILLNEYNFKDRNEVLNAWMSKEEKEKLEINIQEFEKNLNEVKNNLIRIKSKLKGDSISKEDWEKINKEKREKTLALENKSKFIAVMEEKLRIMKNNLDIVIKLNKKREIVEHEFSLLDDLHKLVQGNKFVEFIASSRLKYIAREASKTLKEITRGRYALEVDGTGNFIMRDDFNGGIRRSCSTLSGGETFLTSLSLALALSSQIQLNNTSPLEFFFLDEGFGTLDNNLLDVVMNALEKLNSQQLCVGIISHVEELKNRIPVKLIVEPAYHSLEGSKVRIEYS